MSCYFIYYAGGAKMMRPVETAEDYRALRNSERNRRADKRHMAQMNYSCLPNADGSLRGATRMSGSVGMDVDFDPSDPDYVRKMADVPGQGLVAVSVAQGRRHVPAHEQGLTPGIDHYAKVAKLRMAENRYVKNAIHTFFFEI